MKLEYKFDSIQDVIDIFLEICKIPHGSGNTKALGEFIIDIAKSENLDFRRDDVGNIIVWKPSDDCRESDEPIAFQSHIDMVCNKTPEKNFDFKTDCITPVFQDDLLTADNTTLGADNGIGVAMMLALLKSKDIKHPPLEMIFTNDEEIGLDGAAAIDLSDLKSKRLINLDTEEEGYFICCSAGGFSAYSSLPIHKKSMYGYKISVKISGLHGGHSGMEIDKGYVNANKLMGQVLEKINEKFKASILDIHGGISQNIISQECDCDMVLSDEEKTELYMREMKSIVRTFIDKHVEIENNIKIDVNINKNIEKYSSIDFDESKQIIQIMSDAIYGVEQYSAKIDGLVETSINPGCVSIEDDYFEMASSIRTSSTEGKKNLVKKIEDFSKKYKCDLKTTLGYPAWEFNEKSRLREIMVNLYEEQFKKMPIITGVHGGLECGFFSQKIKDLDCISIGPTIQGAHSPSENVSLKSINNTYSFLIEILKRI